jgi:methionine synthase I (cobalamin-dependent)
MGSSSGGTAPSGDKNRASFPETLAAFIGGCCGTDPGNIRKMAEFILK